MASTEQLARLFGKTTFTALRAGFGHGLDADPDADIKGALGIVRTRCGELAARCMETHYASTLAFEAGLRRAWWEHRRVTAAKFANRPPIHVARIGGALAIRALAGIPITQEMRKEWAWLAHTSQATFDDEFFAALNWCEDESLKGARVFLDAMQDVHDRRGT